MQTIRVSLGAQTNSTDSRLLAQPGIGTDLIGFAYAGDLWTARLDGTGVRRITTADGDEQSPIFSPDGRSTQVTRHQPLAGVKS